MYEQIRTDDIQVVKAFLIAQEVVYYIFCMFTLIALCRCGQEADNCLFSASHVVLERLSTVATFLTIMNLIIILMCKY